MKIANILSVVIVAATAAAGVLFVPSLEASAMPANGAAIAHASKQVDGVINVRRRCPNGQVRDRHGYCVPSAQGF
jgi:hypothetical protein